MLGNGKVEVQCFDGEKRVAHIRGKMRKKVSHSVILHQLKSSYEPTAIAMGEGASCGDAGMARTRAHRESIAD